MPIEFLSWRPFQVFSSGETIRFEASNQVCIKSLIPSEALQQETFEIK